MITRLGRKPVRNKTRFLKKILNRLLLCGLASFIFGILKVLYNEAKIRNVVSNYKQQLSF